MHLFEILVFRRTKQFCLTLEQRQWLLKKGINRICTTIILQKKLESLWSIIKLSLLSKTHQLFTKIPCWGFQNKIVVLDHHLLFIYLFKMNGTQILQTD